MNNCRTRKCSCEDQGLHSPCPACGGYVCTDDNPCPETFSDMCVIHTGDPIVELGIETGDSLAQILQKIALLLTNPTCFDPNSTCRSPLNVHSIAVSATTMKIGWTITGAPTSFNVQFSPDNGVNWYQNPAVGSTTYFDTVGNILPDTEYLVRVLANCAGGSSCLSVTIKVKTPALTT